MFESSGMCNIHLNMR